MKSIFQKGHFKAPVLVLLHGTGGDEHSLLAVGKALNPQASLLSIRGDVLENGMPRFFRRLSEGVYDEADLAVRSIELSQFIQEMAEEHHFSLRDIVLVGYSNGANIAIRLMLDNPEIFQKAVLFHPMYPLVVSEKLDLRQANVWLSLGKFDPIVPVDDSETVVALFESRHAQVTQVWTQGHQLTYEEVAKAGEWLGRIKS